MVRGSASVATWPVSPPVSATVILGSQPNQVEEGPVLGLQILICAWDSPCNAKAVGTPALLKPMMSPKTTKHRNNLYLISVLLSFTRLFVFVSDKKPKAFLDKGKKLRTR
jgi:hypothetical protein